MLLDYEEISGRFVFYCEFAERLMPKENGFCWDPQRRHWYTKTPSYAHKMYKLGVPISDVIASRFVKRDISVNEMDLLRAQVTPEGLTYYDFQLEDIWFSLTKRNVLIADDMGLGKTPVAVGVCNKFISRFGKAPKTLVVCPASLKVNWCREFDKWSIAGVSAKTADSKFFPQTFDILVVNYDILDTVYSNISSVEWDLIILDECHKIKNLKTKRTKLVRKLKSKRKLALTGTPILNKPGELYPIISWLQPENFSNYVSFISQYCGPDGKGATHLMELNQVLSSTVMIRHRKVDVLKQLPPKTRQIIELPAVDLQSLISEEMDLFNYQRSVAFNLKSGESAAMDASSLDELEVAAQLLKPGVIAGNHFDLRHKIALKKVPYVLKHLDNLFDEDPERKLVVFAHHKDVIKAIRAKYPNSACISGDTKDRQAEVDRFQEDKACTLFVGSITAAGVGITLTASSHVIFAEMDWVPAVMLQAEDRCHRIGQLGNVLVQYLVLEGSLDARVVQIMVSKMDVINRAIDGRR